MLTADLLNQSACARAGEQTLGKTALLPREVNVGVRRGKEGARGGNMGSPALNEWGYSCRLVDLIPKLV